MAKHKKPKTNGAVPADLDRMTATLTINRQPIQVPVGRSLTIQPPADPNVPFLLMRMPDNSWSGVVLAPGLTRELRAKPSAAKTPTLWRPGMPS